MAFEAKRIRIQLPCGEATVQEQDVAAARQAQQPIATGTQTLCRIPSVGCGASCVFPTNPCQDFGSMCGGFASPCQRFASPCQAFASPCGFASPCQGFASPCGITDPCQGFASPCGITDPCGIQSACGFQSIRTTILTETICAGSDEPVVNPGTIVVDQELLPVLREQLEAQLREVAAAEQAVRDLEQEG